MSIFQVDTKVVTLSGVILSAHITLYNPHQILAVIFELESKPPFLEIEPLRGMIMQGERKIIKLRCKNEARASLGKLEKEQNKLIIRGSYFSEYNKKVMAKNSMKGWSLISKQFQETVLPVYFNFAEEMQKVRQEAHRSSSLRNSRKMNSFEKFRESSIKRVKNQRLNEDLDFIFRNEQFKKTYESKYSHKERPHKDGKDMMDLKANTSPQLFQNFAQSQKSLGEILSPILKPNQKKQVLDTPPKMSPAPRVFQSRLTSPSPVAGIPPRQEKVRSKERGKERRGLDLIILAIIAALFLGFGEGMGRQLKY